MARVGEFVRDNASLGELGEIRKFEYNLKRRVRASKGEFRSQSRPHFSLTLSFKLVFFHRLREV